MPAKKITAKMSGPRWRRDKFSRDMARRMRDNQWTLMEKVDRLGKVWFCPWDKHGFHKNPAENESVHGLIGGMEFYEWFRSHKDWWKFGRWSERRCAHSIRLTDAGREALRNRDLYDMEPVTGGMVEPGWAAIPTAKKVND